ERAEEALDLLRDAPPVVARADVLPGSRAERCRERVVGDELVERGDEALLVLADDAELVAVTDGKTLSSLREGDGGQAGAQRLEQLDLRSPTELDRADGDVGGLKERRHLVDDAGSDERLAAEARRDLPDDDEAQVRRAFRKPPNPPQSGAVRGGVAPRVEHGRPQR